MFYRTPSYFMKTAGSSRGFSFIKKTGTRGSLILKWVWHFMKLGISSEDLQVLIMTRLWFHLIKGYEQQSTDMWCESKTRGWKSLKDWFSSDNSFSSLAFFMWSVFIPTSHFIPSFSQNWGTLWITLLSWNLVIKLPIHLVVRCYRAHI
jgi:hypothetical protein